MILNSIQVKKRFTVERFCTAFRYQWDDGFFYSGESHDFWEIVYVEAGEVQVTEDANVYRLKPGELILHAPMEFHSIKSDENTPTKVLILSFATDGALPEALRQGVFRLGEQEQSDYRALFRLIYRLFEAPPADGYAVMEGAVRLAAFLIGLSRGGEAKKSLVVSRSAQEYYSIVTTMTESVYENIGLEDIAAAENISVSYLKLLFKTYSGTTPKLYWSRLRCNEAIKLLQQGMTPSEIADMMNFSSPNYFSTFFKRIVGVPPKKYLQTM